ncbi:DUF4062 domain-containing protein [Lysobacter korlensis]|uniref:DUF4062 domain-containing protein n=1 Tax=Lysobacter korlensis TaxID=553636 RepID=A0ABV6RWA8_9GAMM
MEAAPGAIRTPDQRLRIFISSTLKELAPERKAVRAAIERMGMSPILFEMGARPHPPRELYRAYLQQSDVFVGIYGERYGWVAPGEQISGLEDEYRLAPQGMPKLIYIKETPASRDPRLAELLDRIRNDDSVSFKAFAEPEELAELVGGDLAVLLAERFDGAARARSEPAAPAASRAGPLPTPLTETIGRSDEVAAVTELLSRPSVRLVTLAGPGGIGKTRLAIDVASRVGDQFADGVTFVALSPVDRAALVPGAIAQALGVRDSGAAHLPETLASALRQQERLLVLDNFEQVVDAAPLIADLLTAAPRVKALVTSRALLRVAGEHSFEVGPLGLPTGRRSRTLPASVTLFVERARAVRPDFDLTPENIGEVEQICIRLEGVPLALELAAARVRILSPAQILERLDRRLTFLVGGRRDLPPRQQALRSTIEWSAKLLSAEENDLLATLGVFTGRFSVEAVERIADAASDVLAGLGSLVDSSLLRQQERNGRTYFTMLATVREFALERLESSGGVGAARDRHARHYADLAVRLQPALQGAEQRECMARLNDERDNVSAAARHLLDRRDWDAAADLVWRLFLFWWAGGHMGEARRWMEVVLRSGEHLADRTLAIALYITRALDTREGQAEGGVPDLERSVELFRRIGDRLGEALGLATLAFALADPGAPQPDRATEIGEEGRRLFREAGNEWGETLALVSLGRTDLLQNHVTEAVERFHAALEIAQRRGDDFGATLAHHHLAAAYIRLGDVEGGRRILRAALRSSTKMERPEGIAYGLEGLAVVAATRGDAEEAGMLLGAAEVLREQRGLPPPDGISVPKSAVDGVRGGRSADAFQRGYLAGRRMPAADALDRVGSAQSAAAHRIGG